jgi:hypothetical protein
MTTFRKSDPRLRKWKFPAHSFMPRTPCGPKWLKIRVQCPDSSEPAEYDVDPQGKLVVRPERQQRRANLYLDALGPSVVKPPARIARYDFPTSPPPPIPQFPHAVSNPAFFPGLIPMYPQQTPMAYPYQPEPPRPPPRVATPEPIPVDIVDPVIEPFWGESLGEMGWFEPMDPYFDPFMP